MHADFLRKYEGRAPNGDIRGIAASRAIKEEADRQFLNCGSEECNTFRVIYPDLSEAGLFDDIRSYNPQFIVNTQTILLPKKEGSVSYLRDRKVKSNDILLNLGSGLFDRF